MIFANLICRVIWFYIIFIGLWLILRLIFFDSLWWLALINTGALYLFSPLIIFLPFSILCRRWKLFSALCFPLGVFIAFWGAMHIPNFPKATSNDNLTINVMSFNILFKNDNYDELVKMVNNNSPDIIGLQEVFPTKASKIKKLFLSDYPYQTFNPFKNYYTHNVALLSRFPIIDTTILPYKEMERGLRATLDIGGGKQIQVIVAHLVPNYPSHEFLKLAKKWYSRRLAEASYLQKIVKNRNFPIVMMCDCNFTDTSEAYSRINSVMDDSFYQAGWGFGHSFKGFVFPLGRIDYIWNTRELRAIDAYVAEDAGSDHLPIMAKLSFSR